MQSWSVPCRAPGKGSDTLRVTLSIRNTRLALWGCRCSTEGNAPSARLSGPQAQSWAGLGWDLFFKSR